jgi:hypothetical protein
MNREEGEISNSIKKTCIISYHDKNHTWQIGIPQAFKYKKGVLFTNLFYEIENKEKKLMWIQTDICKCLKIINIDELCEVMQRDEVTSEDLDAIEDFRLLFTQEVIK